MRISGSRKGELHKKKILENLESGNFFGKGEVQKKLESGNFCFISFYTKLFFVFLLYLQNSQSHVSYTTYSFKTTTFIKAHPVLAFVSFQIE